MAEFIKETVYENGRNDRDRGTRERANAGLTLGIIGTVLGAASLWGRNNGGVLGGILGGGGSSSASGVPANVNINATGGNGAGGGCYAPTAYQVESKECADVLALTNEMWGLKVSGMHAATSAREVDVAEKFALYKEFTNASFGLYNQNRNSIDAVNARINNELFSLYKYTRDKDDETRKEISDLKAQVAVNAAIRPYQDALIQCSIDKAYTASLNALERRTCKMVEGYVCLPSEPTVTGLLGATCCFPRTAAAGGGTTPTT